MCFQVPESTIRTALLVCLGRNWVVNGTLLQNFRPLAEVIVRAKRNLYIQEKVFTNWNGMITL